jgi:hypothetical protein
LPPKVYEPDPVPETHDLLTEVELPKFDQALLAKMWCQQVWVGFGHIKRLVVYLANGPKNSGRRTQFLNRLVGLIPEPAPDLSHSVASPSSLLRRGCP